MGCPTNWTARIKGLKMRRRIRIRLELVLVGGCLPQGVSLPEDEERWRELGQQLRIDCVRSTAAAGSGHPTSAMSAADLMAVLLDKYLCYDFDAPAHPGSDHLIFSKGHAAPLLYAMYKAAGAISDEELLTLRRFGSRLEGHPTPRLPWVEVATGSLGQGLPIGVGIALGSKRLGRPGRVWVLCGDGEMAEGSMWEAVQQAGFRQLDNLTAIIDVNRFGQLGETMWGWDTEALAKRIRAFGWHAIEIDGHSMLEIDKAYAEALAATGRPLAIIARTVKGKGVAAAEDRSELHSKVLPELAAVRELGGLRSLRAEVASPRYQPVTCSFRARQVSLPCYQVGCDVSLRVAYGESLAALGAARTDVVAIDADVANSTFTHLFAAAHPERFFQAYIAEQQMLADAVGLQVLGYAPFVSTFAAFLLRAYDFVRMAAISDADLRLVGSHPGVSIGRDGPSQMALEDIAAFRAVHGSTVLYPSDANQTAQLVSCMADRHGISYLRVTRAELPVLYNPGERFYIGGSRVVRASHRDDVAIVAAGITLHEALRAAGTLASEQISARVIDLYSVKPLDTATLLGAARAAGGRVVTVEDHRSEGGLGDAVLEVLAAAGQRARVVKLAVHELPGSGDGRELLRAAGVDAAQIVEAVRGLIAGD
jgi:transketolase